MLWYRIREKNFTSKYCPLKKRKKKKNGLSLWSVEYHMHCSWLAIANSSGMSNLTILRYVFLPLEVLSRNWEWPNIEKCKWRRPLELKLKIKWTVCLANHFNAMTLTAFKFSWCTVAASQRNRKLFHTQDIRFFFFLTYYRMNTHLSIRPCPSCVTTPKHEQLH